VPRHRTHRLLAIALAGALVLSACGGSGSDDEAQARAEAIDLTVSDFPDGWTAEPATDDEGDSPLDECDPSFTDDTDELAEFRDDDFLLGDLDEGDGTNVTVETKVFASEEAASAAVAPFSDPEVLTCIDEALKDQFGGNAGNEIVGEFSADEYVEDRVDETVSASAEYAITATDGSTQTLLVGVLILRTGDLASQVLVLSVGEGLSPEDLQGALDRVAELQAA
jgi:hypothetical protein